MFGMGITLTRRNFTVVLQRPRPVLIGVTPQFLRMSLAGWLYALLLGLPTQLLVGLVMVGCSPGGPASNVICCLANGDVALSITLTVASTLLALLATPLLTLFYAGQVVAVPVLDWLLSTMHVIIVPVGAGGVIESFPAATVGHPAQPVSDGPGSFDRHFLLGVPGHAPAGA